MADNSSKKINQSDVPTTKLLKRFTEAETARKKWDGNWARNMRLYKSKAWDGIEDIAWFQSHPQYNKVFEFVEIMRGFLSDNKWGLDVIPASIPPEIQKALDNANAGKDISGVGAQMGAEPEDPSEALNLKCTRVNKLLDFLWSDCHMSGKLASVLLHVFVYGTGIVKSVFDPDNVGEDGIGQIETTIVDPLFFYPDPDASSMFDGSFYFEKHPVSVRWVIERYPDEAADFLKSVSQSTMTTPTRGNDSATTANVEEGKRIDVLECWYKDSAVLQDDIVENGKVVASKGDKKYPNGRYTLMSDKGYALEDKATEYDTMHPYVRFVEIPTPNEFWGDCTIDKVADLQILINEVMRSIVDNAKWMVHGIWIVDDISGVTPESLAGYGMRDTIVKKVGTDVHRDVGEPLPVSIFQLYENSVTAFDRIAGIPDVMRGIVPSRQPVQTTQLQQESGEVRTRERSRRVEESLEDLGKLWLSIVSKFWIDKRTIRSNQMLGGYDLFQLSRDDLKEWRFDLMVRPGSTTPLDLASAYDRAKSMRMELGIAIPDEFFVRMAQIPMLETSFLQAAAEAEDAESVVEEPTPDELADPNEEPEGNQFPMPEGMDVGMDGGAGGFDPAAQNMQLP